MRFVLKNVGKNALTQPAAYTIFQNINPLRVGQVNPLRAGDSTIVAVPATGDTWRLEFDQEPFAPGPGRVGLSVEGCRRNGTGTFTTGYVQQFPVYTAGPWQSILCIPNRGSYDPNDKAGLPVGVGPKHYILPGTELDYTIRFQNTGTDTAFNVVIRDTLSRWLDPTSVVPGVSSHPYRFELTGAGILVFSFPNIMLPDSNANQLLSNGYVRYRIRQRENVPLETDLLNRAAIYFDFNDPIMTNTTVHRVGVTFRTVRVWTPPSELYRVTVAPQPFAEQTRITVEGVPSTGDYSLEVFTLQGTLVRRLQAQVPQFELAREGMNTGMYLFRVQRAGKHLTNGRLLVTDLE